VILVDTGPFLGRWLRGDQHHHEAVAAWEALRRTGGPCATTNFILDEVFTLLGRRAGYGFAAERARSVYGSRTFTILRPGEQEERAALELFEKYSDQKVSFTDCISFAFLRARRMRRVFTFDAHFARAGFQVWP